MDEPHWVKRFTEHGAPGAYCRVVTPGTVAAGDPVRLLRRPSHGVTIGDVFVPRRTDPQRLRALLSEPGLVPSWPGRCPGRWPRRNRTCAPPGRSVFCARENWRSKVTQLANQIGDRPPSMARMVVDRVAATPDLKAFSFPADGGWEWLNWSQVGGRVRAIAAGLLALGLRLEDRVAVASSTRVDWILADFGIMCAGGATTTVYPSTPDPDVAFIVADSGARFAFAEDDGQIAKLRKHRDELPALEKVITFDGSPDGDWVIDLSELESLGARHLDEQPSAVDEAVATIGPQHLATLIYTSGTTGRPKGVRLVHDCWTYEGVAINALQLADSRGRALPLAAAVACLRQGAALRPSWRSACRRPWTATSAASSTILRSSGPRWSSACRGSSKRCRRASSRWRRPRAASELKVFKWAVSVGDQVSKRRQAGKEPAGLLAAQYRLADRLVFQKLRERFGGRLKYFVSGSAALSRDVQEFFHGAGILMLEGYGLTETSASIYGEPAGPLPVRHRRSAASRHRGQGRPRRRDPRPRPRRHAGISQACPTRRRRRSWRTAGCTPATSASSRTADSCASPIARRTSSRPPAESTSRRRPSRSCSRPFAPTSARSSCTASAATTASRW